MIPEVEAYITGFGRRFLEADLLEKFPEMKILPKYLKIHFPNAKTVLDLGCGTGLYFWASFIPSLRHLDGIDLYQEFINEADRVVNMDQVPEGYKLAHNYIGEPFVADDFKRLKAVRGAILVGDFRKPFPEPISSTQYDLITEFGSIGEVATNTEFIDVVKRSAALLRTGGAMMFANFLEHKVDSEAQALGRFTPDSLTLNEYLYRKAVQESGMEIVDFHAVDQPEGPIKTFFYGFALKK